ncbi:PREDICTED: peptidyl-prolyl cis-trans isomerase FKBP16-2, chloroplastic-like [Populus euphratica]|uniref:peptidylprolyl isomerase n=1 Tax=Populus euphratica TaxID=75702 RepID=A0AAJ6T6Q0_POPEU|nr:PREDICTED: peptidyl-prolyl cis-trans isomerase FKBP16-2, chloroplastic-like [Populus euphratica]
MPNIMSSSIKELSMISPEKQLLIGRCQIPLKRHNLCFSSSPSILVRDTARFADGIVLKRSYKRDRPLAMCIGVGKVIGRLDQGILGGEVVLSMQEGGKHKLHIPPLLAYGPEPAGCFSGDCNIPGNSTLLYDINFVRVQSRNRSNK